MGRINEISEVDDDEGGVDVHGDGDGDEGVDVDVDAGAVEQVSTVLPSFWEALYKRRYSNQKEISWSFIQFGGTINDKSAVVKDASPRVTTARLISLCTGYCSWWCVVFQMGKFEK